MRWANAHLAPSPTHPLPLSALCAVFFEKREGFQWSAMLMNPMVIMMGVTLLIVRAKPESHTQPAALALTRWSS